MYIGMKAWTSSPKWTFYTGSCNPLNADIAAEGASNFEFEILYTVPSHPWAKWAETHEHFVRNVVFDPMYYNDRVGQIRWAPARGQYESEMRNKLS